MTQDYQHRGTDEHGNADDNFTEEEALAQAAEQGIEFVDVFTVEGDDTQYAALEEATEAAGGKPVIQTRSKK